MYDQCVNRDMWQQFHGGHIPGLKSQEAISTKQTSDFSPKYFEPYFPLVCPLQVQVLGTSKVIAVKHTQGQVCWVSPPNAVPTKAKETFTPNPGFSDSTHLHYPPRNNDKGTSPGLVGVAGDPVVPPALPALAKTSKSSSFQPQHNKAILCHTGTNFCENCQTDDAASNF